MKKWVCFVFVLSALLIFSGFVSAADVSEVIGIDTDELPEDREELEEEGRNYLKEQWAEFLEKTSVGRAVSFLDPFVKFFVGVGISFSVGFLSNLILWVTILVFIYGLLRSWIYFLTPPKYIVGKEKIIGGFLLISVALFLVAFEVHLALSIILVEWYSNIDDIEYKIMAVGLFFLVVILVWAFSRLIFSYAYSAYRDHLDEYLKATAGKVKEMYGRFKLRSLKKRFPSSRRSYDSGSDSSSDSSDDGDGLDSIPLKERLGLHRRDYDGD